MFATARRFQATKAYNEMLQTMKGDLKKAMMAKDNMQKNTIRSVLSTVKNNEIDGAEQNEFEMARVLNKMIKQRIESARIFSEQNRPDLVEAEEKEASAIRKYILDLPVASEDDIRGKLLGKLEEIKSSQGDDVHVGAIFKQITKETAQSWGASPSVVKAMVPALYKQVFQK